MPASDVSGGEWHQSVPSPSRFPAEMWSPIRQRVPPPTVPHVSAKPLPVTRIVVDPWSGPDEGDSTASCGRSNQEKLVSVYCWALRESDSVCDAPGGVTQRSTPASRSYVAAKIVFGATVVAFGEYEQR
jgi:hypothetical protein